MMIILIDIGNSTIAIGISESGESLNKTYRINTEKTRSADEYAITLSQLISGVCERAIIASVVPELNNAFREYFQKKHGITPLFLQAGVKTGIKILTDTPREVGADLIANAIGATTLYDDTCLIIDLGTATTFTYVENKNLRGVVITTGLMTSRNALISKTSLLPQVELEPPSKLIGTNSSDSIKSGLIYGHAALIDGMVERIKDNVGNPDLKVIITGGHAQIIYKHCRGDLIFDDQLILKGLLVLDKLNKRV
ncbi:MAG: type III pantothenate kinase [Acholeplasmataceae bacterium]|nr:type III pantothenate kinase [Acholeplasmataceae bacterium]